MNGIPSLFTIFQPEYNKLFFVLKYISKNTIKFTAVPISFGHIVYGFECSFFQTEAAFSMK